MMARRQLVVYLLLMQATRTEVEAFNQADPFYQHDVWDKATIHIHPFLKRRGWVAGY